MFNTESVFKNRQVKDLPDLDKQWSETAEEQVLSSHWADAGQSVLLTDSLS